MLKISVKNNLLSPAHEDIHVIYEEIDLDRWVDAYYLVFDMPILPGQTTAMLTQLILKTILENWHLMVENLEDNNEVILTYEFSDQYIGFLYVKQMGTNVEISKGWTTKYQGYSFDPSAVVYLEYEPSDLNIENAKHQCTKAEFLENLRTQIALLE